jgi:cytochrome oxidase assembly protein ShyY1
LLSACALFATAGFWQLDRMAQKQDLFDEFDSGMNADPLPGLPDENQAAAARYRPVLLQGRYDETRQILLDNMVRDGQSGYQVLTPLRTATGTVMVNRGWVAADADRKRLPRVDVSRDSREVLGLLDQLPRPGVRLSPAPPAEDAPWPRRLLFPNADDIAANLGYAVVNYQLLLDPDAPDGFERDWRPGVSGPVMHLGYAVQWFAFAAAATVIYLVLNLKKVSTEH